MTDNIINKLSLHFVLVSPDNEYFYKLFIIIGKLHSHPMDLEPTTSLLPILIRVEGAS